MKSCSCSANVDKTQLSVTRLKIFAKKNTHFRKDNSKMATIMTSMQTTGIKPHRNPV